MAYIISRGDTQAFEWTDAWSTLGISWQEYNLEKLFDRLPDLAREQVQHAFLLPDRSMRPDILLTHLAACAENTGVEIRSETPVNKILYQDQCVTGVETTGGEMIAARMVVLAGGATGLELRSGLTATKVGCQDDCTIIPLKTHLIALKPELGRLPFCVINQGGFNHVPHAPTSVFGSNVWTPVSDPNDQQVIPKAIEQIWNQITQFFPTRNREEFEVLEWAGTTIQAMHLEQIEPGLAPLSTVIDHQQESPGLENFIRVFPGKATLWAHAAEDACRMVQEKLKHSCPCAATPPWACS
jgi:glycine/D-amino acid oxidase-like deaminating enzyme